MRIPIGKFLELDKIGERRKLLESYGLKFVKIFPGKFNMGRQNNRGIEQGQQKGKYIVIDAYEMPEHPVKVSSPYWISRTLIEGNVQPTHFANTIASYQLTKLTG